MCDMKKQCEITNIKINASKVHEDWLLVENMPVERWGGGTTSIEKGSVQPEEKGPKKQCNFMHESWSVNSTISHRTTIILMHIIKSD